MKYRYYLTQRPPSPGTFSNRIDNKPIEIHSFDDKTYVAEIDHKAWGWVEYSKPLELKEVNNYELMESEILDLSFCRCRADDKLCQ